jgi:hypothetical protein
VSIEIHITPQSREALEKIFREAIVRGMKRHFTAFPCTSGIACDTCADDASCRRIGQCLRYKCEFGKVDKP